MKALSIGAMAILLVLSGCATSTPGDTTPPSIVELWPENGAQDVSATEVTDLVVTFNEAMTDESWSWVEEDLANFPEITSHAFFNDEHTVVYLPVKLKPDTSYVIWLNSETYQNFTDASGNALTPVRWTFTTATEE